MHTRPFESGMDFEGVPHTQNIHEVPQEIHARAWYAFLSACAPCQTSTSVCNPEDLTLMPPPSHKLLFQ